MWVVVTSWLLCNSQVVMKLESYQALGDGFKGLAREYGVVKQQLAETRGMLAKYDDLRTELADNWHDN